MINKNNLNTIIIWFWNNFLDFKTVPNKWENLIISHSKASELPETELYVLEFKEAWRIISIHEKYYKQIEEFINWHWYSFDGLRKEFEKLTGKTSKIAWPILSAYLFSDEKLLPVSKDVIELKSEDIQKFNDFMNNCPDCDKKEVDMNFEDPTHRFFILNVNWEAVSLCNYSIDEETRIAHIGIITLKKYQWKGYAKTLVNSVVHNILDNWLYSQYRADKFGSVSIKIALSLWFEIFLESYSFRTDN